MYVVTIITPANKQPEKMVLTYYVRIFKDANGTQFIEWDEDINYAKVFTDKLEAKKLQSYLRKLKGSEDCKIKNRYKFSKQ